MQSRTAGRVGWSVMGAALVLAGVAMWLEILRGASLARSLEDIVFLAIFGCMGAVGALVLSREPHNAVGWILVSVSFFTALAFIGESYSVYGQTVRPLPALPWAWWVGDWVWIFVLAMVSLLPLLFPDGKVPTPRWRPYLWLVVGVVTFVGGIFALDPRTYPGGQYTNPIGIEAVRPIARVVEGPGFLLFILLFLGSSVSLVLRYRRADRRRRQQIKWFLFSVALLVTLFLVDSLLEILGLRSVSGSFWVSTVLSAAAFASVPIGIGIAILRYRLYDIDVVINRTVLFGILAAVITAIYVGIVIGIGSLVGGRGNLFLSIAATAVVAVAFQPIRARAAHFANRLVYGKRATPYEVLSTFSDHLGEAYSTEDILPRIARMIWEATGAERATVWVHVGDQLRPSATWPDAAGGRSPIELHGPGLPVFPHGERAFAVRHQGELLGALSVTTSRREPLNETQERLLEDLAGQAGLILRNVRLIEELRASRQRLVAAQDQERRRLERNIHDGAQQQLVALAVKLRLARTMTDRDMGKAQGLLDELQGETQDALENLRDLARGIYPPLLADKGLAAALEAQARKVPFPVRVEPNGLGRYAPETEATAYFCVLEALQNATKYAEAASATIRLTRDDGHLVFSVADDGRGFDPEATPPGSGLQNMADRVEALGGTLDVESRPGEGTTVTGRVPIR